MDLEAEKRFHHLLEQALDLEGEAVADYLERQCGDDTPLRRRLVLALETVDEHALRQPSGVERVALEELAFGVPPQDLSAGPIRIGPYQLLELLGTGGMGRVFLAEQQRPLRRRVALKLLKTSLGGAEARIRFQAEQQALARLDHPNVGRILEAGATEDGVPYFAMELVSGEPLIRYCDRQALSLEQRLRLMIAVCRGVEHAHRKQVLHRDLKPSNILVSEVDGVAVPKIIDFGIAKALDQPLTDATLATGGFLGTPTYMSPEALDGTGDLDTRTDVYSLGVLLYELLAGVKPHDIGEGGLASLLLVIRQQETPRPSTRWNRLPTEARERLAAVRQTSMAELGRRLKHELDWVVLRAMAKDREQRYGSAAALAEDLERYLAFQPLKVGPPSVSYQLGKWLRRHRLAVVLVLGLLIAAGGAIVYHLRSQQEVSDRTAQLTREVERIEWMQRVAYQLPLGDRTPEKQLIRQAMGRIEGTMLALDGLDRGAGRYALGRGAMALHETEEAHAFLRQAWDAGYHTPEAAVALGWVLSELYEQRLNQIRTLPNAAARRLARRRAGQELRDPAIEMLTAGRESRVVVPSLLEGHIALLKVDRQEALLEAAEGKELKDLSARSVEALEQVLALSGEALKERPWLYEAHFLSSRAYDRLADLAIRENTMDRAEELLRQEAAAVEEGLIIGRSDPWGHLRLCRAQQRRLGFLVRQIRPGVDALHRLTLEACALARRVDPQQPDIDLIEAEAWLNMMEVEVWDRNEDPSTSLREAEERLRRFLAAEPDSIAALNDLAWSQSVLSIYLQRQGRDPAPAMGKAIDLLEQALVLEPNEPSLHIRLTQMLADRANYEMNRGGDPRQDLAQAEHYGRLAVAGVPDDLSSHLYLGSVFLRRAQYLLEHGHDPGADISEGLRWLQQLLDQWPNNLATPNTMANFYMLQGLWRCKRGQPCDASFETAVEYATQSLTVKDDAPYTLFTRGQSKMWIAYFRALRGEDFEATAASAREDFTRGLEILPNLPGPYIELAHLSLAEARYALAKGTSPLERVEATQAGAQRALDIDPRRADAKRLLADAELVRSAWLSDRGQSPDASLRRARLWAEEAVTMEPGDAENQLAVARWAWRHLQSASQVDVEALELGLEHCDLALAIDPTATDGNVLRGALLLQDPARQVEGQQAMKAAFEANPSLEFRWGRVASQVLKH